MSCPTNTIRNKYERQLWENIFINSSWIQSTQKSWDPSQTQAKVKWKQVRGKEGKLKWAMENVSERKQTNKYRQIWKKKKIEERKRSKLK